MVTRMLTSQILDAARTKRILVIGDLMLDRYTVGHVSRISPEAPVPVLNVSRREARPGGAANVALNICSLGGCGMLAGAIGDDGAGDELCSLLEGIDLAAVVRCGARTTEKDRVVADRQQVVRIDTEERVSVWEGEYAKVVAAVESVASRCDGIIIEDYGKGVISQPVVDAVLAVAEARGIPVGLDPKDNHDLAFRGLALATPNWHEACMAVGLAGDTELPPGVAGEGLLAEVGAKLSDKWGASLLAITLGPDGMYLYSQGEEPVRLPTRAREVYDVSGAGDTVIAAAMLAIAAGAEPVKAAALANCAAGVVVAKLGTATCSGDELLTHIGEQPE
jgi:rfaE bifunctional protein kinase chain/domain